MTKVILRNGQAPSATVKSENSSSTSFNPDHLTQMLRLKQAADLLGVSLVTLWRLGETDPTFPKKIRITARCCGYRRGDLIAWQNSRMGGAV